MNLIRRLLCTTALLGFAGANAFAAAPQNGSEYMTLPTAQPTESGKKDGVLRLLLPALQCV
jgi:hypothetical protein